MNAVAIPPQEEASLERHMPEEARKTKRLVLRSTSS